MSAEKSGAVNLKTVAEYVGLAPCSVSAILNETPAAKAIPQMTKDRVCRAAAELNYRPNLWARSLRTKRTRMVAVVASDFASAPVAQVIAAVHKRLHEKGYMLAFGAFDFADWNRLCAQFRQRGIEGLIVITPPVPGQLELPVTSVDLGAVQSIQWLDAEMRTGLTKMGESAAKTIILQIEDPKIARRLRVEKKVTPAQYGWMSPAPQPGVRMSESA